MKERNGAPATAAQGPLTLAELTNSQLASAFQVTTVFVPLFAGVGISPELTQAAYRVGDSVTNVIAPLNPYVGIVLVYLQRCDRRAGLGSMISLMLPYTLVISVCWTTLLLIWLKAGWPLGPGGRLLLTDMLP